MKVTGKNKEKYQFEDAADIEAIQAFERGELKPAKNQAALKATARKAAANYIKQNGVRIKKEARINIRLAEVDLVNLKMKAEEEGMPYQTLIASVLHKFVAGRLTDKAASKRSQ